MGRMSVTQVDRAEVRTFFMGNERGFHRSVEAVAATVGRVPSRSMWKLPVVLACALLPVQPGPFLFGGTPPVARAFEVTASTLNLPQTGQMACFDVQGASIGCEGTGQDGEHRVGVVWPVVRFIDNLDGTFTDALTGLMWLEDANCVETRYPAFDVWGGAGDGLISWQAALDFVNGINDGTYPACGAGQTDWRLANVNELFSLIHLGHQTPETWLEEYGFDNVVSGGFRGYWSSTSAMDDTDSAYVQKLDLGGFVPIPKALIPGDFHGIWPVRAFLIGPAPVPCTGQTTCFETDGGSIACSGTGQDGETQAGVAWPNPRSAVTYCDAAGPCADQSSDCDADGSTDLVWDRLTGLEWPRNANLFLFFTQWQGALDSVTNLNGGAGLCGHHDWRLPNLREMTSLVDFGRANPALPATHSFVNLPTGTSPSYWTSTFSEPTLPSGQAWWLKHLVTWSPLSDSVGTGSVAFVWPVRAGYPPLFADGFESGDTSEWSSAMP